MEMKQKRINYLNLAHKNIHEKYSKNLNEEYNLAVMKNILEKDKCHIVALFKEFLLYYDDIEFLKRFYKINETRSRLINISYFYKENLIIAPNYSPLEELKYFSHNIRKKQILRNRILNNDEANQKSKILNRVKNKGKAKYDNMKKKENDNDFFTNKIYNEILDESESFIKILFGMEEKNQAKDEISEEIEDYKKIIDHLNINDNINNTDIKKKNKQMIGYKKPNISDICICSNIKLNHNHNHNKNENYYNSLFIRSMDNSTATGSNSHINSFHNQKNNMKYQKNIVGNNCHKNVQIYQKMKINDNISPKKEIVNQDKNNKNNLEKEEQNKQEQKIYFHRKIKSTLISDCVNNCYKLDLPSNLSVINTLRIANQNIAQNNKNKNISCNNSNIIRINLYKKMKKRKLNSNINNNNSNNINVSNSLQKMTENPNETYTKKSIGDIIKSAQSQKIKAPYYATAKKGKENKVKIITKLTKMQGISKKIEMHKIKTPMHMLNNKYSIIKSPIYKRNHIPGMSLNNSNNNLNNYSNAIKINSHYQDNSNLILNSCRKSENIIKNIYVNQNLLSPYSKPKGIISKDTKYINISGKKLFTKYNTNNILNIKNNNNNF